MKLYGSTGDFERVDPNMTSMIDVCFMMLIFFIANMRLLLPEGDFSIKMPAGAPGAGTPNNADMPMIMVRLQADARGNLASIHMGERRLSTFDELHREIRSLVEVDRGPAATPARAKVEIDCDYNLSFENAVDALSAISGYVSNDKQHTVINMVDNIQFAPPRRPGGPAGGTPK